MHVRRAWEAGRSGRGMLALLALLLSTLVLTIGSPALAQEDEGPEVGFQGTITRQLDEGGTEPVEGVVIAVSDADGAEIGEATTDAEGRWVIGVPESGSYTVAIDPASLPEGVTLRDPDTTSREVTANPGQVGFVLFPTGDGSNVVDTSTDLRLVLQLFVEGLQLGLLIAMMAIGLSLVFGTTGLVNFAHGEIITLGAVVAWFFNVTLGLHLVIAAVISIVAVATVSAMMDLFIFRKLRQRGIGLIAQLVITIGLSLFLRYLILAMFGGDPRSYGNYAIQRGTSYGPITLSPKAIWTMVISIVVLVLVGLMLQRTRLGRAMRAVSDNVDLAESSGIDVQRVILYVWAIGGGLAAFGGILWGVNESVSWIMGFRLLLPIFAGMILGGIGTAYGALVGSLVVGVFIQMSTLIIPSELKNAGAMVILILILVFRPQGILGRSERIG
ncbi:MAG TPA: branched-chain amino acid ABC transporter permease [Nitriliruptoraceae bacterium]|nr:branched-chain amino acid ABC transporter permease [Nitriliruptoraceae bacterium]